VYAGIMRFRSTVVLRNSIGNDAQPQLVGERPERLQELLGKEIAVFETELDRVQKLSEPGKPVSDELRQEAVQSRLRSRKINSATPARIAEARAVVGLNHPEVKKDSPQFNTLAAETLAGVQ
jgi:hypothetical protein